MTASGQLRLPSCCARRSGEVDLDLVACDGDGDADLQLPGGRLQRVARLVAPVGEAGDGSADDALGVAVELVHRGGDSVRPAPLDELREAALGQPVGGQLSVEVAPPLVRVAHVREQDGQQLVVEAHRREHEPLLVDVGRARGEAGRLHAADVGVVRARAGEAAGHAGDERDVGEMRAAGEGIVDDVDLAGLRVAGENGGDGLGHGAEVDGDVLGLDDHAAALVEEGGRAVAPLLDVGREGRADQHGAHLLRNGAELRAKNLVQNFHSLVSRSVVPSLAPTHPGGIQQVAPSSSTVWGPSTRSGSPAGRRSSGPGRTSAVRTATSSISRARSADPYRSSCARWKRSPSSGPRGTVSSNDCPR